ncbi:hypothetical protein QO239_13185 [Cupriavidus taiwanensis]|uniref:ORC-CDC6 family AAA ATPase n=1 Tax=Cupriavidus taiwanensis TaxID=164546 RepID=UPI002541D995|nr:hypothetical protein [Cupriavidus taiwanensis]MDK3023550.1 hypothetical protein [Cupriavidus taiwanensis]
MNNFYLRTESIKPDEIRNLFVASKEDRSIISALRSPEPCILEGSRGTGKSFLMRIAQQEIDSSDKNCIAVFVSFNVSSLINTDDAHQFYHWMLAKSLRALLVALKKKGFAVSTFSAGLLSRDETADGEAVERNLEKIVKEFEVSYKAGASVEIEGLPDIEEVKDAIQEICIDNDISRVYFFFDEAAHVFRPEQQRQFFSLFKDLRSPYITCNAAIYPGVTYFGDSFEPIHDCLYRVIERDIRDPAYIQYFKEMVLKQAEKPLGDAIENNVELFATLAYAGGGNPRMILKTVQDLAKFNSSNVDQVLKDFYRNKIWSEHTSLGEKYKGHKNLIDWGRDFLEKNVIIALQSYNEARKHKGSEESSIYFWIHKDAPETVKEALRLLTYTGVIRKTDASIRATRSELGARYEVKYGCLLSLFANPHSESKDFYHSLSVKKYVEFGKSNSAYASITELSSAIEDDEKFVASVQSMMKRPISVLSMLSKWQIEKLQEAKIYTVEDLYNKTEDDLIEHIYGVGPARARIIKNAVSAELLEYLSG